MNLINAEGLFNSKGKLWSRSPIWEIIKDPIYIGKGIYGKRKYIKKDNGTKLVIHKQWQPEENHIEIPYPRIITDALWRKAQRERMAHRSPLFQPERLKASLLLAHVKDNRDIRVNHSRNLATAVRKAGGEAELMLMSDEEYGMHREENRIAYGHKLVEFLSTHLNASE